MPEVSNEILDLEDKARLNLTLNVRERIIKSLTDDNKLPTTTEDRNFLLQALDGMDRTVLTKTRIKNDDKNAKSQQETSKMIAGILSKISIKNTPPNDSRVPELPDTIKISNPIPGEKDIGVQTLNYDEFMKQNTTE